MMCIRVTLMKLDFSVRPQTNSLQRFGLSAIVGTDNSFEISVIAQTTGNCCENSLKLNTLVLQLARNSVSCAKIIPAIDLALSIKKPTDPVPASRWNSLGCGRKVDLGTSPFRTGSLGLETTMEMLIWTVVALVAAYFIVRFSIAWLVRPKKYRSGRTK